MSNIKIYSLSSKEARLADCRCRIVHEIDPREPCYNEDMVFKKVEDEHLIPANALHKWKFNCNFEHEPIWFYTTAERCKKMVSEDPSYWTKEKLLEFERIEKKLYQDWYDGCVYGYIFEKWDDANRQWQHINSCYGFYGIDTIIHGVKDATAGKDNIIICAEDEVKVEVE